MAIRYYCDHCGLEVLKDVKIYTFGIYENMSDSDDTDEADEAAYGNKRVLLCAHCAPIWMKRVSAITEDSNPRMRKNKNV